MLSTKNVKIHSINDERWTIRDKLAQYRGILKLHARDKKLQVMNAKKLKKKISRDLITLKTDVKKYRAIINNTCFGDKRRMHTTLQQHKDFQLALHNLNAVEVYDVIYQDNHLKQKQLDKMYYEKTKRMKEFVELKLEWFTLTEELKEKQAFEEDYKKQNLITLYRQSISKHNAAKSIQITYQMMLDILKKDSVYFDEVLNTLKVDQKDQCRIIFKATVMGQLTTENLDDIRQRYKRMTREVWVNMKERERTLEIVRNQLKDLWAYTHSLVRIESDTDFTTKEKLTKYTDESLEQQIQNLEEIFEKVKKSLLVCSYEELFSRVEEQVKQKKQLTMQFNQIVNKRNSLLNQVHHAELVLASLNHSVLSTTGKYKTEKKEMQEEMKIRKKREIDFKQMSKNHGELLLNVRAALQNILSILVCIKPGKTDKKVKENRKETKINVKEQTDGDNEKIEETALSELKKIETNGFALLSQISRKVGILSAMSNFDLTKDKEEKAKDLYQSYISDYMSKLKFTKKEPEATGFFVEHEVIDTNILTRADIKLRSKKVVEANIKLE